MADKIDITDELRSVIGVDSKPWIYEVTTTSVRGFARGVGYTDPVYFDLDAARKAGYRSLPCPPTYLGTPVFIPGQSHDIFSGPRNSGPKLDHGLKNVLDGGTETEYLSQICAGDTLTVTTQCSDLNVRESRTTGQMLIVTNETTCTNQDGDVVAKQRSQGLFY